MNDDLVDVLEQQLVNAAPAARRAAPERKKVFGQRPRRAAVITAFALRLSVIRRRSLAPAWRLVH